MTSLHLSSKFNTLLLMLIFYDMDKDRFKKYRITIVQTQLRRSLITNPITSPLSLLTIHLKNRGLVHLSAAQAVRWSQR